MEKMTIKTMRLLTSAIVLLPLASCNSDDKSDLLANGHVPMSFVAGINSMATRATTSGFEVKDMVGIIPVKENGGVDIMQVNIAYTNTGTGFYANPPYYFQDFKPVLFNAYYPYDKHLAADFIIPIDSRAENQVSETVNGHKWRKNDFLFTATITDVNIPTISLTDDKAFKHVMSSISFKFKAGTTNGVPSLEPLTGFTLGSLVMDGTFDCSTGAVALANKATVEQITIGNITCAETSAEYTTEPLIVLPQTVAGGKFTLTVRYNNVDYTATLALAELAAGTRYEFPVTVKNTGLEIGNAEITDWSTGTTTGGDAFLQ